MHSHTSASLLGPGPNAGQRQHKRLQSLRLANCACMTHGHGPERRGRILTTPSLGLPRRQGLGRAHEHRATMFSGNLPSRMLS